MTRGANRLVGGETTRGKRPVGKHLWAKRLGEEMIWGRNDPFPSDDLDLNLV